MPPKTINEFPYGAIDPDDEFPFWDKSAECTKRTSALNVLSTVVNAQTILGVVSASSDDDSVDQGNSSHVGSIAYLTAMAVGDPVCIICTGNNTFSFDTAYTIPANVTLIVFPGAQILVNANLIINGRLIVVDCATEAFSIASTKTLTINGPVTLGSFQVFTGDGSVTFGSGSTQLLNAEWWGLSEPDNTAAVQAAIDAAPLYSVVMLPARELHFNVAISKTITLSGEANNIGECYFYPYLDSDPVITLGNDLSDHRAITVRNMSIDDGGAGENGIRIDNGALDPIIENVEISGFSNYCLVMADDPGATTEIGTPRIARVKITAGAGTGLAADGVPFVLQHSDIIASESGDTHALDLTDSTCWMDQTNVLCRHNRGVLLENSTILRSGGSITATPVSLMTLEYLGSGTSATVSIEDGDDDSAADSLTTTCVGEAGDNLNIDLNAYESITALVTYINTTYAGTYEAVALIGDGVPIDLSLVAGSTDIKSTPLGLFANIGIEKADSTELGYYSWVVGPGKLNCSIKNQDGLTCDAGDHDLVSWSAKMKSASVDNLAITTSFAMIDTDSKPCNVIRIFGDSAGAPTMGNNTITAYHDTNASKWYLVVDFNGTAKKVELT